MALHSSKKGEMGFAASDLGERFGEFCDVPAGEEQLSLLRDIPYEKNNRDRENWIFFLFLCR